jgi:elongator complex protein 3
MVGEPEIIIRKYNANDGIEWFISAEDPSNDVIFGFLRLRKPSSAAWRSEIVNYESYLVRELHVYGVSIPIGVGETSFSWQHRGIGSTLLKTAEEIVSSLGGEKIIVISGVGVREYYYKRGYFLDGPYVSKFIRT